MNQVIFSRNCLKYMLDKCVKNMKIKQKKYETICNSIDSSGNNYENISNSFLKSEWYLLGGTY